MKYIRCFIIAVIAFALMGQTQGIVNSDLGAGESAAKNYWVEYGIKEILTTYGDRVNPNLIVPKNSDVRITAIGSTTNIGASAWINGILLLVD